MFATVTKRLPELIGVVLALVLASLFVLRNEESSSRYWAMHTVEVQATLHDYESAVLSAESGQRGFLMSNNDSYLTTYDRGLTEIPIVAAKLKALVSDSAEQSAALEKLREQTDRRIAHLARTLKAKKAGDEVTVQNIFKAHPGKIVMAELRATVAAMIDEEKQLYRMRSEAAERSALYMRLFAALGVLVLIGALTFWAFSSRAQQAELKRGNEALAAALAETRASAEQIRQMQKMEAVGQLTGGIAHDFNNMLSVIISGISLGRRKQGEPAADTYFAKAVEAAERAAKLVKKLMSFSRQQPLSPEVVNANKLVSSMSDMISRTIGDQVRMETILAAGLWTTYADATELETTLLNLCNNARDAMPDGGKLTVETANCHLDERYAEAHPGVPPGQYILIAVTDTGIGMAPAIVERAFDPFFTTKPTGSGTGLGLSQVYGFVKQSGGHIKIYSEPGAGTTVKVYLTRHYGSAEQSPAAKVAMAAVGGDETILLVEDDPSVLALTSVSLKELGYTVHEASSAEQALRLISNGLNFDLLMTDVMMPDVNGRKLSEEVRALVPAMRVLFMTGFTKNAIVHNGTLDAGVHLLAKPFTMDDLARKVREALKS